MQYIDLGYLDFQHNKNCIWAYWFSSHSFFDSDKQILWLKVNSKREDIIVLTVRKITNCPIGLTATVFLISYGQAMGSYWGFHDPHSNRNSKDPVGFSVPVSIIVNGQVMRSKLVVHLLFRSVSCIILLSLSAK